MRKLDYNLARSPRLDVRAFALRALLLLLLALLLAALAGAYWGGRRARARHEAVAPEAGRFRELAGETRRLRSEIESWRRTLGGRLAVANALIERKSYSFVARLDFLENAAGAGIRLRRLSLANQRGDRVSLSLSARSLGELFAFYKKLSAYGLAIASETQTEEEYLVNLSFSAPDPEAPSPQPAPRRLDEKPSSAPPRRPVRP
jgi:cbb3-type cytochrome oxidase subunit 3